MVNAVAKVSLTYRRIYHFEGHSDFAGGREDEEMECGRMAG